MALSGIECPQMHWDSDNLKENWCRFKQHMEVMFSGPLKSRQEAEKCSYLVIWVGQKERDIYNMWTDITNEDKSKLKCSYLVIWVGQKERDIYNMWTDITIEDKSKLKTYYDRFEAHVSPRANPVFARSKFHGRVQGSSETARRSSQIYASSPKTVISKILTK